jgi:hypothetical protein
VSGRRIILAVLFGTTGQVSLAFQALRRKTFRVTKTNLLRFSAGEFLHEELIPSNFCLEDTVPSLQNAEEKKQFLEFIKAMLRWVPEERKTAKELLEDPWLARPT